MRPSHFAKQKPTISVEESLLDTNTISSVARQQTMAALMSLRMAVQQL
jgi:hypothetical protein